MIEPLLLSTTRISTYFNRQALTTASGFFFERDKRLFLVTSRHVLIDAPSGHFPNRMEVELHTDASNLTCSSVLSVMLLKDGKSIWHQGSDAGGEIDVAVVELDRAAMPASTLLCSFTPKHLQQSLQEVALGSALLVVGFPLGFHDTLHHLPVARQATIASAFGLRFQGQGYFLTDARTHRGTSGAPVVMRDPGGDASLPWKLLGVHSSRLDMGWHDLQVDELLGLNCAWYADILMTLTAPRPDAQVDEPAQTQPRRAFSMVAMSILTMSIMATNTRLAAARSGSASACVSTLGVICHDKPHLSLHQPQALACPPLLKMASHRRSVSA
jgi:Trypsin-like peptidase domain